MGGVCSVCCGQRRKNNYEPLLLENEREAVADLLQYLESEYNNIARLLAAFELMSRSQYDQLFHGLAACGTYNALLLRQRRSSALGGSGLRRNHRERSTRGWTRHPRPRPISFDKP